MGRPPKKPDHPLTRLRKMISTPENPVTREMLGERCGIPAPTIRDIETGRITRITEDIAVRIMLATGVDMQSLLKGEVPLKDLLGKELSPESRDDDILLEIHHDLELGMLELLRAAINAVRQKKRSRIFLCVFREWLPKTIALLGATEELKKELDRD